MVERYAYIGGTRPPDDPDPLSNLLNTGWTVTMSYAPEGHAPSKGGALVYVTKPGVAYAFAGAFHMDALVDAWTVLESK